MAVTFAGEGLDLIADRPAAGALVERMVADAVDTILAAPDRHLRVADEAEG